MAARENGEADERGFLFLGGGHNLFGREADAPAILVMAETDALLK